MKTPASDTARLTVPGGALIAFEGVDGAGKTTQVRKALERLTALGYEAVSLREPSGGVTGLKLREVLSGREARPDPETEYRLFLEDRADDVERNIKPALRQGRVVLIDRYYISSMAYQGALGLDPARIREENERFAPRPDLTLLFHVPLEVTLARIDARSPGTALRDPFEVREFQIRVHALLSGSPEFLPERFPGLVRIDADRDLAAVHEDVMDRVESTLRLRLRAD